MNQNCAAHNEMVSPEIDAQHSAHITYLAAHLGADRKVKSRMTREL